MSPAARAAEAKPSAIPGGFISVPDAFKGAPSGLEHVIKLIYRPNVRANGDVGLDISADAFVVDLGVLDAALFDASMLAADCDFLKGIALAHEDELRQIITELQRGTEAGAAKVEDIARSIGATEADAVAAGGGLIWIAVGLGMLLGGCLGAGSKQKATSPAATTTPKPPPAPQ